MIREEIKGLSKGYGFIRCIDQSVVSKILASTHKIQGRVVDVNHASEKWETEKNKQEIYQRKLFINGITSNLQESHLRAYFQQFGPVKKAFIISGHENSKKDDERIGFVEFFSKDVARITLDVHWHEIVKGSGVYVSVAVYNPKGNHKVAPKKSYSTLKSHKQEFSHFGNSFNREINKQYFEKKSPVSVRADKRIRRAEKIITGRPPQNFQNQPNSYSKRPKIQQYHVRSLEYQNKKNKWEDPLKAENSFDEPKFISRPDLKFSSGLDPEREDHFEHHHKTVGILNLPESYIEGNLRFNIAVKFMERRRLRNDSGFIENNAYNK